MGGLNFSPVCWLISQVCNGRARPNLDNFIYKINICTNCWHWWVFSNWEECDAGDCDEFWKLLQRLTAVSSQWYDSDIADMQFDQQYPLRRLYFLMKYNPILSAVTVWFSRKWPIKIRYVTLHIEFYFNSLRQNRKICFFLDCCMAENIFRSREIFFAIFGGRKNISRMFSLWIFR